MKGSSDATQHHSIDPTELKKKIKRKTRETLLSLAGFYIYAFKN